MPMRPSSVRITGNWKATPKAKISDIISERYSPTFGNNWICAVSALPICCMPSENRTSIGSTTKYTSIEPSTARLDAGVFRRAADAGAVLAGHAADRQRRDRADPVIAEGRRISLADDVADLRLRRRLPIARDPDAAGT